ncbi:MAG: peptidylprolyl isomerase [Thermoleophilaceae bacterium]
MNRPLAVLLVPALAIDGCGGGGDEKKPKGASTGDDTATQSAPKASVGGCKRVSAPGPKPDGGQKKPASKLSPGKIYDVTLTTNCGAFTIRLDEKRSPATAASFAALARKGFFDNTVFHRIVPGFVIQGGDPTGSGQGGPGYSTTDKPAPDTAYTRGVVAMAKTGAEPPGTAGSQFYVVTGPDAGLPAEYAVLGKVTKGLEVTGRIGKLGDPQSGDTGTPLQPVVIEKATVTASRRPSARKAKPHRARARPSRSARP